MSKRYSFILLALIMLQVNMSCKSGLMKSSKNEKIANESATKETKYLLSRIKAMSIDGYAFGQQDAMAYGLGWKNNGSEFKSDVSDVTGDFPAVHGFDIGHIEKNAEQNLDTVNFGLMRKLIQKTHKEGGVVTISWHPDNPVSNGNTWDVSPTVKNILEGRNMHTKYQAWISKVADFMNSLKTKSGKKIPVVFRPYHEMNGNWFWWGTKNTTPEEYKQLWRETFDLLTKTYKVNNLLFCYSTDVVKDEEEYLRFYPGDEYVDILGIDLYHKNSSEEYVALLNNNLGMLSKVAKLKSKPFVLSEGGLEKIPIENWWTEILDKNVIDKGLSWVLVWRNAWPSHYYAPFKGQISELDFKKFQSLNHVYFLNDIKKIK